MQAGIFYNRSFQKESRKQDFTGAVQMGVFCIYFLKLKIP